MKNCLPLLCCLLAPLLLRAQVPETPPPPRTIKLEERKFEQLSDKEIHGYGTKALEIDPKKWRHAETEHFVFHYRRVTEAQRVVREIEYALWYVARALHAEKERYAKKSHVYIFRDRQEWEEFLGETEVPEWSGSFAYGDELFLHIGGMGEEFNSQTLAHETTHAVVARLYPNRRWPLWLNEGFAEVMGTAAIAARKGQYLKGMQGDLPMATLSFEEMTQLTRYPQDRTDISRLYQSGEKFVRFLMAEYPQEKFPAFVEATLGGADLETALKQVYGVEDFAAFRKKHAAFRK